jgi:hypothetical protein
MNRGSEWCSWEASWVESVLQQLKRKYKTEEKWLKKRLKKRRKLRAKVETVKTKLKETVEEEEVGMFNFTIPFDTFLTKLNSSQLSDLIMMVANSSGRLGNELLTLDRRRNV